MESAYTNNTSVIQHLLQRADELTNQRFGFNSKVTFLGGEQHLTSNGSNVNTTYIKHSSDTQGLKIEEVDEATANQITRSLASVNAHRQYQLVDANVVAEVPAKTYISTTNYNGELFQDPNGPQIIRRPAAQNPVTYRQNVSVRFLQPPPVPPPGPLIIKEVRAPQPPAPPPLVIRQRAPPLPVPPPLILRERPPRGPAPIPSQTVIKKLAPIPVPPRSIIIERYPPIPPRPRDIVIERWLPYSKEPQRRKVVTYRAPPPRPYPAPRNTIVVHDPVQANVVRAIRRLGVQPQNPQEYAYRHGPTLLDSSTLVAHAQQIGVVDDLSLPPVNVYNHQYVNGDVAEYYLNNNTQTVYEPEYSTTTAENQAANNNEQVQVYWTDPHEDIRSVLQRLGLPID